MSMTSILRTTLLVLCAWSHCFFYADGFVNHNTNTVAGTTTPKGAPFFTNCESTVLSIRHQSQTNKEAYFRRPSTTAHEQRRYNIALQAVPGGMQWFVKTEQFCKPYPQVKPYLEAHREWVRSIRENSTTSNTTNNNTINNNNSSSSSSSSSSNHQETNNNRIVVSGYRVDAQDKPGGGGLMIFAAVNYADAEEFVRQDPLVANECVDWQLNRWIPETGDISLE